MPDLLASIQIMPAPPGIAATLPQRATSVPLPGSAGIALDFGTALSGLLIPGIASRTGGERQATAEGGKALPDAAGELADEIDPTLVWLPEGTVPLPLPAALPEATASAAAPPAVAGSGFAAAAVPASIPASGAAPPTGLIAKAATLIDAAPTVPGAAVPESVRPSPDIGKAAIVIETAPATHAEAPAPTLTVEARDLPAARDRFDLPVRDGERPQPAPLVALQPQAMTQANVTHGIAAQVFATALNASADPAPLDRTTIDSAIQLAGQAQIEQRTTVQAMSSAAQVPLDMSQDDWTAQMIDRIAALRDSAEATDTRIKLAPENLGALEVSIRRDGDRVHVHFTADNPAARQMIADAAPRLADLADARGVKLGQTSVDAGTQQGSQQDGRQPHGAACNSRAGQPADPAATDERIA